MFKPSKCVPYKEVIFYFARDRPYSGFFSLVLKFVLFVLLLLRTNIFPHDQRTCVGVWCMCARKRRKLN